MKMVASCKNLISKDAIFYTKFLVSVGNGMYAEEDYASRRDIDGMATVEAIPVEWIEQYAKRFIELEKNNYFAYGGLGDIGESILRMIEIWAKENQMEATDETD